MSDPTTKLYQVIAKVEVEVVTLVRAYSPDQAMDAARKRPFDQAATSQLDAWVLNRQYQQTLRLSSIKVEKL